MAAHDLSSNARHRIAVDDVELEYADIGAGEPVLLIHAGVFADWFVPVSVDPALADYRVIRMRRAGYTDGPAPARHLTIDDHGRHCAALLDHLGLQSVHVVGHSSGSLAGLSLAAERPDLVSGLVLIEPARAGDTWPASDDDRQLVQPIMDAARAGNVGMAFDTFMSIVCATDYRDVLDRSLGPEGPRRCERESAFFFADEMPAVLDWPFDEVAASGIRQRVLLVQGGNSPPPVHQAMAQLADWLPDAAIETVPDSDHLLPLRHPAVLAATIAQFIGG